MIFPAMPVNENERLNSLYMMDLLDKKDDERFDRLTRMAKNTFDVPIAIISLLDRERQWLLSHTGIDADETPRNVSFCAHAILEQGALIVKDTLADPRFAKNPHVVGDPWVRFYAGCPVRLPDGAIAGTICIVDTYPRPFSSSEIDTLLDFAALVEDEFFILSMAMTDNLTGMQNSRGFYRSGEKRFAGLKEHNRECALLYFSIDNLKPINELLGNKEGDAVVKNFATNLNKCLKDHDLAARLGGGEFAVLLGDTTTNSADAFLLDLQSRMDAQDDMSGKNYHINYSYGMVENEDNKYASLREMLDDCDKVMHTEKRRR
ncbi:sensor domain-containing diguanylate cyclase [Kosakonia oryzendophytica]|uniref:sensor domain-containing diguanylate cyclase n=1 Tax=Kosakonia oryzendophytica TaxID=1005665 RepID=UPI003D34DF4E